MDSRLRNECTWPFQQESKIQRNSVAGMIQEQKKGRRTKTGSRAGSGSQEAGDVVTGVIQTKGRVESQRSWSQRQDRKS